MPSRPSLQIAAAALLLCAATGRAQAAPFDLTGAWTLQSMIFVDEATGKTGKDFGDHPKGYAIYTPDGYMSVVINAQGRLPVAAGASDAAAKRAKLLTTMTAHAGPYRFSHGVLVNQVEVAHDPGMVGEKLTRHIRVIDATHYESATPFTTRPDGRRVKTVLIWQKAG